MIATMRMPASPAAIEAALTGLVALDLLLIEQGVIPPFPHDAPVIYRLEAVGEEDWKNGSDAIADGWADCEDLAAWCTAGLMYTGEDPDARCVVMRTGPTNMHCVVLMSNGDIWDPSLDLGMADNHGRRGARKAR